MTMNKDVLFYSNFCPHSKSLINKLTKLNAREDINLICVDKLDNLPVFVNRVPMLMLKNRSVLADESLQEYIANKYIDNSSSNKIEDISPFLLNAGYNSAQYTFISPDGNSYVSDDSSTLQERNVGFGLINDQMHRIQIVQDRDADYKVANDTGNVYEKILNERKHDDEILFKKKMI